jgi:hypothetical protein
MILALAILLPLGSVGCGDALAAPGVAKPRQGA